MTTVVALLRGVNIGGHHKVGMETLKELLASLALKDVRTYIQSGNAVFRTGERDLAALSGRIEDALERKFGFRPGVMLRTAEELRGVIERNPFAGRDLDPARLVVMFLASEPAADAQSKLREISIEPEEVFLDGREMYIYFPVGQGRSKLPWAAIDKAIRTPGTARNWRTVTRLLDLCASATG
jgi:uncharacterized protein (DUF1697 family)